MAMVLTKLIRLGIHAAKIDFYVKIKILPHDGP